MACHCHLFTVYVPLNAEWESYQKKCVYALFLSDLAMYIKIVSDMIAFPNLYLVKSVNLVFTHVLFRSVYHDVSNLATSR